MQSSQISALKPENILRARAGSLPQKAQRLRQNASLSSGGSNGGPGGFGGFGGFLLGLMACHLTAGIPPAANEKARDHTKATAA
jgi:hypothetical protein